MMHITLRNNKAFRGMLRHLHLVAVGTLPGEPAGPDSVAHHIDNHQGEGDALASAPGGSNSSLFARPGSKPGRTCTPSVIIMLHQ
eukprot:scaffold10973_cov21-Tisochrysis_lutea.AAC.1